MAYVHRHTELPIKIRNRLNVLALFPTLILVGLLVPRCLAQEAKKPQSVPTGSAQKPTESPSTPPSLSSLLTQTVIFIYQDNTPQNATILVPGRVLGTAFIVGVPQPGRPDRSIPFIVTAKHVVADQTRILGRYTNESGAAPFYAQYDLESLRKSGDFWEYPNDEGVDMVVFRTLVYENVKFLPLPTDLLASTEIFAREHVDVSDRVMIPGLMENFPGVTQNYPIFRDGSISLITEEPISFKWKLGSKIIETKQRIIFVNSVINEGFSGAPVFLWPGIRSTPGGNTFGGRPWLVGIVHGFFPQLRQVIDTDGEEVVVIKPSKEPPGLLGQPKPPRRVSVISQENSATGIVFPSWQLLDILQSEALKRRVQQLTDEENKTQSTEKK